MEEHNAKFNTENKVRHGALQSVTHGTTSHRPRRPCTQTAQWHVGVRHGACGERTTRALQQSDKCASYRLFLLMLRPTTRRMQPWQRRFGNKSPLRFQIGDEV